MAFAAQYENHAIENLDLNRFLNPRPLSTFFFRVSGDAMEKEGIHDGDFLTVDRSLPGKSGELVIAEWNNELTLRRLILKGKNKILRAANPKYPDVYLNKEESLILWGVVTSSFRKY